MEGGGAHLGLSLPMSAFIHRQSFLCAGGCLCLQAPFSFVGIVFIHGRSPSLVGGRLHLHLWVFTFSWVVVPLVWLCCLYGIMVGIWFVCGSSSSWAVVLLVGCSVGVLVGCGGGGKLVWWWGVGGVW